MKQFPGLGNGPQYQQNMSSLTNITGEFNNSSYVSPHLQADHDIDDHGQLLKQGLNPLVTAAATLINIIIEIKHYNELQDVEQLQREVTKEIKAFEANAKLAGCPAMTVLTARYVLCCVIDEVVMDKAWDSHNDWSNHSMLSTFHQETAGGEKFFYLLDKMLMDAEINLDILELIFICLSLGYEGKYRIIPRGREQLDILRSTLFRRIRLMRDESERILSNELTIDFNKNKPVKHSRHLLLSIVVSVAVLGALLIGFSYSLQQKAEPLQRQIQSIQQQINNKIVAPTAPRYTS